MNILLKDFSDYRMIINFLDEKHWEYHTHQLPEENPLRVFRISVAATTEEISQRLKEQMETSRNGELQFKWLQH